LNELHAFESQFCIRWPLQIKLNRNILVILTPVSNTGLLSVPRMRASRPFRCVFSLHPRPTGASLSYFHTGMQRHLNKWVFGGITHAALLNTR